MSWLADWLEQVILIILLAAFIDLLLPNQAMQRYVRTVVSLFILMTLLNPVLGIFEKGWNAERLITEAEKLQNDGRRVASKGEGVPGAAGTTGTDGKIRPLQTILADSERMRLDNDQEAVKLAETRLSEEMRKSIESRTGAQVKDISVQLSVDNKGYPEVKQVRATLLHTSQRPTGPTEQTPNGRAGKVSVEEVKPVTVDIRQVTQETKDAASVKPANPGGSTADDRLQETVKHLETEWAIPQGRIRLTYES